MPVICLESFSSWHVHSWWTTTVLQLFMMQCTTIKALALNLHDWMSLKQTEMDAMQEIALIHFFSPHHVRVKEKNYRGF